VTTERLSDPAIQRFLAGKEVAVLATVGPGGAPLAMPMWFLHGGDALAMVSVAESQKVRNIRRDPRVCVVAEAVAPDGKIMGITVRGRAELLGDGSARERLVTGLLDKYHPRLEAIWGSRAMPPNRAVFRIAPESVRSWGLPAPAC
jgi:PPOX class probable F420-dependent enzyme